MAKKKTLVPKELTTEELTNLQSTLSAFNQAKMQVADATLAQQDAVNSMVSMKQGFAGMEQQLVEKYGKDVSVNVQTGALTYKEDGTD